MPVVIEQLSTSFEVRDEARIRKLVQKEIELALTKTRRPGELRGATDPADPAAGGAPQTQGGS
jgi:hypothetical protein